MKAHTTQSGFALLLTLVIVSVVLAIGLSLLDITLKQLELSGTARDSEIAFHAAYAGAECAQHWRLEALSDLVASDIEPPDFGWCITGAITAEDPASGSASPAINVRRQVYEIDSAGSCIEVDMYIFDAATPAADVSYDIPTLTEGTPETCDADGLCTYVLSRGYNRSCSDLSSTRTIQREIVIKF